MRARELWTRLLAALGAEYLCDTCRYDYPQACNHKERPNARRCPDYRRR